MRISRVFGAVAIAFVLSSAPAWAAPSDEDIATARVIAKEGVDALAQKDYKTAEARFESASKLYPAPTLFLGLARARVGLGKFVAAQNAFQRVINEASGSPNAAYARAAEEAKTEYAAILGKIASVVITVTGTDAPTLTLDDQPMSAAALGVKRPVDPGTHSVKATAAGFLPGEAHFTVVEGGATTASIALEKDPNAATVAATPSAPPVPAAVATPAPAAATQEAPSNGRRTGAYVAIGVGAAGIVVGVIGGLIAVNKHSTLTKDCTNGTCPESDQSTLNGYHSAGALSTVGFVVGIAGAATGIVLLATAPKRETGTASAFVSPYVGAGSFGAFGRF